MKNFFSILLIMILIIIISTLALFAEEAKYDFRETTWGMSKEQVKATEDGKPGIEDDTSLAYKATINGKEFACAYSFLEDKLYAGGYIFIGEHTNENLYIEDYEDIKETLTKKYGKPKTEMPGLWNNDLYKDDKSNWGKAISMGHLGYGASWETSTTRIYFSLWGDNYNIKLALYYTSKELEECLNKIKEEKTTMDTLYENMEKSMKDEDIELIQELTNKAMLLLPENEREELIELQTRFGKYGYSALTENETRLMQELNNKAINLLPENDRTKLDGLLKKVDDSLTEETKMVQTIRNIFPTLSQKSAEKFVRKANDRKLTNEEFLIWANELAAKGEVFLSDSQMEEMASLWWKAVGKLPVKQQDFIQSVTAKMRLGQQLTLEESGLVSTYVGHGLTLLSPEDKDKYFYLRSEALEEALKRESGTINVRDYIKDKFPPVFSLYLSSLDDLDSYEKEFIDLLEKLPEEEQDYYAKKVYEYGFYREILEIVKEGKPIAVYSDAYDKAVNLMEKREYKNALSYLEIAIL